MPRLNEHLTLEELDELHGVALAGYHDDGGGVPVRCDTCDIDPGAVLRVIAEVRQLRAARATAEAELKLVRHQLDRERQMSDPKEQEMLKKAAEDMRAGRTESSPLPEVVEWTR